jgi:hypothetical protein
VVPVTAMGEDKRLSRGGGATGVDVRATRLSTTGAVGCRDFSVDFSTSHKYVWPSSKSRDGSYGMPSHSEMPGHCSQDQTQNLKRNTPTFAKRDYANISQDAQHNQRPRRVGGIDHVDFFYVICLSIH